VTRPITWWWALAGTVAALALALAPAAHAAPATFSYAGAPVPIPDGADLSGTQPGAPVTAPIAVSGLPDSITDVDFRIDGSSCDTVSGSATVGIDHTFVNDLEIKLTSPTGTTALVIDNTDGGGNNLCQVLLDDDAVGAPSIQTAATAQAPFGGTWMPANPLSAFDGQNPNGTWTVSAQDFFSQDTGNIRAVSIVLDAKATPVIAGTSSADIELGGSLTDAATVAGRVSPTAGDSVDFRLYGPDDATCAGPPVFDSLGRPVDAGGAATSAAFTPATTGVYRWVAAYSGDANNFAAATACGAAGQTVVVQPAAPPPPPPPPPPAAVPPPPPPPAADAGRAPAAPAAPCTSRRRFALRLIPRPGLRRPLQGARITSATLIGVGGRPVRQKFTRTAATIDLRGLPKGRFAVRVGVRLRDGSTISFRRTFATCSVTLVARIAA
jgi:subtilisin-like proprotein convertase family protein